MPGEFEPHVGCWMVFPERLDTWRAKAGPAQATFAQVANAISQFEPVTMVVSKATEKAARAILNSKVRILVYPSDDSWMRDIGPTFVRNKAGDVRGVDWIFNAWGGQAYESWDQDDLMAKNVLDYLKIDRYRAPLILEGGSIHSDGEGTIYTTEECLLNPNRNPNLTKQQIENYLKEYLGAEKVIWIPYGVFKDETSGHVDNICCVIKPGRVFLGWSDNPDDPQYERSQKDYEYLSKMTDARGRKIEVVKMPMPTKPLYRSKEQALEIETQLAKARPVGERLAASYVNFYIANGGIVMPTFGLPSDHAAIELIKREFPDRKVVPIPSIEVLLGGGNFHCITQQEIKTPRHKS